MERILECIPNFSEGNNQKTIEAISEVVNDISGVQLLHLDSGSTANRTVFTIAGDPMKVVNAAFEMVKVATELIDMNKHTGIHPCFGATDVVPLVPLKGVSKEEAVILANGLGERIASELQVPVYMYESAAKRKQFVSLSEVRRGGYVGVSANIRKDHYKPDYGKPMAHPTAGAVAVGVRKIMVAYNVNLSTKDKSVATRIAEKIRESGILITGDDGNRRYVPGMFQHVKAIGWVIPEFEKAQVSMNLMDVDHSALHEVFNAIKELAVSEGVEVTGSEIVGLVPLKCLQQTADYLKKDFSIHSMDVIEYLGLNDVKSFSMEHQVLEYALRRLND